jgi:hypothetical protein
MVDECIWDQEIEVLEDVISFVDNNVFGSKRFGLLSTSFGQVYRPDIFTSHTNAR